MVTKLLAELLEEVQCFILRMAAIFTGRKEQLIFLINNYDLAMNILTVGIRLYVLNFQLLRINRYFNSRRELGIIPKKLIRFVRW